MILEGTIHCEAEGCDTQQHVGADTMRLGLLPPGWVVVNEHSNNGVVHKRAFCTTDCALKELAKTPPVETLPPARAVKPAPRTSTREEA